jgi:ankyrin repeat protein
MYGNHPDVIRLILSKDPLINAVSRHGHTPLHLSSDYNDVEASYTL